jgi:hypothetical protein
MNRETKQVIKWWIITMSATILTSIFMRCLYV